MQGRSGPEARELCVWSPRGTWSTPAGAGRERQKATPGCAVPKAPDRSRPMRKSKPGASQAMRNPRAGMTRACLLEAAKNTS